MQGKIESGVQLFSRLKQASLNFSLNDINPKLFQQKVSSSNRIVEVSGEYTYDLLIDFLIRCILPTELNPDWRGSEVVFINTSHHINILRITSAIDAQLKHLNVEHRKPVIEKALSHITLLICYDYDQLEITLRNLERVIQDRDNVNFVIVDDITSQFWTARDNTKLSLEQFAKQNFKILESVVKNESVILIFSHQQLGNLKKTLNLEVDYTIAGEKTDSKHFIVIDHVNNNTIKVPFQLQTFINFI